MRLPASVRAASRNEQVILASAMAVSFALVAIYVIATRSHGIVADEVEYDSQGRFFAEGHFWWSTAPFGEAHPSAWKAPGYPAWVGFWYALVGESPVRLALIQGLLAPVTVLLTWILARRLFDSKVALTAACGVAVFPLVWEYFGLLFPEALSIPLTLAALIAMLDREPTPGRIVLVGVLVGMNLLVRPTAFFLLAGVAAAWIVATGWRRGAALTIATAAIAVLVVVPWTIRNYVVLDGFIPISIQDAAAYGTFNDEAANDPDDPYAWRAIPSTLEDELKLDEPVSDPEFRSRLQSLGRDYIQEHPASVPKAFFWNGVTRFWDLRAPSKALREVDFQGRSKPVRAIGLGLYYVMLPLALVGLWRLRSRREILWPLIAIALAAMAAFTIIAGTRYRAPLEPVIVILATVGIFLPGTGLADGLRSTRNRRPPDALADS